ncbi:MAG: type II toxin-antitoxin system VapC family toxin [Pelobium sp.]
MGLKALLDTNAIISLLKNQGNLSVILDNYSEIHISVISILEFQSFEKISESDLKIFKSFLSMVNVVGLNHNDDQLLQEIISIRKIKKFKLPDAIIAGTSIVLKADLFTADKTFSKIEEIKIINW